MTGCCLLPGTFVTQVMATDADEPNTPHTKIAYSIVKQEPFNGSVVFDIDRTLGIISVKEPTLDREVHPLTWGRGFGTALGYS